MRYPPEHKAEVRQKILKDASLRVRTEGLTGAAVAAFGLERKGVETYQITLGGSVNGFTALGDVMGPSVRQAEVAATIERIVEVYRAEREDSERFIETYQRIGMKPFKERAYATHSQAA